MTRVLITGVRGKTGEPLAQSLAARPDVEVLGGSIRPSTVDVEGVQPVSFSWDHPEEWASAARGVDAVYLVRPDRPDAPELVEAFLPTLPEAARVVLLSERTMESFAPGDWASRVEQAVRDGGRPWTLLRPSWFMQVLADSRFFIDDLRHGRLPFSSGGAHVAWIDARDIAAVAERALLDPGHDGQAYELSGPEAFTLPETATVLSGVLGRDIAHVERSIDDTVAGLTGFDLDLTLVTFERVHAGAYAGVTDDVERVTGRPAIALEAFARDVLAAEITTATT